MLKTVLKININQQYKKIVTDFKSIVLNLNEDYKFKQPKKPYINQQQTNLSDGTVLCFEQFLVVSFGAERDKGSCCHVSPISSDLLRGLLTVLLT